MFILPPLQYSPIKTHRFFCYRMFPAILLALLTHYVIIYQKFQHGRHTTFQQTFPCKKKPLHWLPGHLRLDGAFLIGYIPFLPWRWQIGPADIDYIKQHGPILNFVTRKGIFQITLHSSQLAQIRQ